MENTKKPTVTIITPAYNCADTFSNTFLSVINQTFPDWEWIIVEDCSTDDSVNVIEHLIANDPRINLVKCKNNGGTACARNIGLKKANGKYITFLDSDDLLDPTYLENQLIFIKDNGPLISAGYRRKAKHSCTNFYVPSTTDYKSALKGNPLSCLSTMYDKEVVGEFYFPEDIVKPEDYVFWLNILKKGFIAKGNPNILATYVIREGSKSSNKLGLIKYMHQVYYKTQNINWFKSWFYVFRWALYGKKKYKNVN